LLLNELSRLYNSGFTFTVYGIAATDNESDFLTGFDRVRANIAGNTRHAVELTQKLLGEGKKVALMVGKYHNDTTPPEDSAFTNTFTTADFYSDLSIPLGLSLRGAINSKDYVAVDVFSPEIFAMAGTPLPNFLKTKQRCVYVTGKSNDRSYSFYTSYNYDLWRR
jgi:hypothetical protein